MSQFVLVDVSSIAYPIWHVSAGAANPNETSQQIVARVLALASGAPHVALCCDSGRSFRADIDTTYKANRPEREAALTHQITLAMDALKAAGFPLWSVRGFEADDLIASAVAWALQDEASTVLVVSADKDLLQLVGPRVQVKNARDGAIVDAEAVVAKFGVRPDQIRDYLTLVGDASDNVKGVKGIGAKRAAELLQAHGSIDALYEKIDRGIVPGVTPAMRTALLDFRPLLDTTRQLITLRTDVSLPFADITQVRVQTQAQTFDLDEDDDMETIEQPQETQAEPATVVAEVAHPATQPQAIAIRQDVLAPAPAEWNKQLEPRSMGDAKALAKYVHESLLFAGAYGSPQAVLSTILAGRELGLQAMASLRAIHIVEGRPTLSADLIRALVIKSGQAKFFRCTERTNERATFETQRGDDPPVSLTYTVEEARAAGLVKDKSGWVKSPADMCVARASAKLARLVYPDLCFGLYTPEEMLETREAVA